MDNVQGQIMIIFFVCLFLARLMGHCFLSSGGSGTDPESVHGTRKLRLDPIN